jgi:hypothetical protein
MEDSLLGSEFFGLLLHTHFEAMQKGPEKVTHPRNQLRNATSPLYYITTLIRGFVFGDASDICI